MKTPTVITALKAVELGLMPASSPLVHFDYEETRPDRSPARADLVQLRLTSEFGCSQVVDDTDEARDYAARCMAEALRDELYGDVIAELRKVFIGLRRHPMTTALPETKALEGIIRALSGEGE